MRFTIDEIDPSLLGAGLPDAFQRFTAEILQDEIPGLTPYPAAGKDGGIDLRADDGVQTVVECKVVGSEGLEHLLPRWRTTADALRRNLKDPAGPPRGQAQYRPWYDVTRPIRRYIVSTTGTFLNAAQEDEFRKELRQLFDDLSAFPHLAHLRDIAVEVRDWTHLWQHTPPWLRLRWFRRSRPTHFLPLDTRFSGAGFREYLDRARLPYYSRGEHLKVDPTPEGLEIHDEDALLARLEAPDVHGMLISGSGGVGKTRLSLELAWRALESGWTVLRASERITANALTELARELTPRDRTLVLFDYVETQPTFPDVVATLGDLNDSYGLHLRYLANCRTSYAGTFQVLHRFHPIDLSPPPGDALRGWLQRYRSTAVGRILSGRGLDADAYREACHEVPVLAVFLCWLADHGRQAEFAALLDEPDIGSWVLSSVRRSLPAPTGTRAATGHPVDHDLALLMGMLPIPTGALDTLPPERFARLRDRLATDVWIERVAEWADVPERWATIHDVLADQVLLAFVRTIPYTVPEFVRELLRTAADADAVEPAFVALQRVFHHSEFGQVRWAETIRLEMERVPAAWRPVRTSLLRSSILTEPERVRLLGHAPEVWAEATADPVYQLAVGSLCRWATKVAPDALDPAGRATLAQAALLAGEAADRTNFVLTHGLRFTPALREHARNWLWAHPQEFQTHYLLVAWLEGGYGLDEVRHVAEGWCRSFPLTSNISYVVRAWLTAGGEGSLVEEPIRRWIAEHAVDPAAQFVYTSWLKADGDRRLVEESIRRWLAEQEVDLGARFVYASWLNANGDRRLVEESIRRWLTEHATDHDATYIFRSWLHAHGDLALVAESIRCWLAEHATDVYAAYVFRSWLDAHGDLALVEESIRCWLAKHATDVDAKYVFRSWLDAHGDLALVEESIRCWLAEHATDVDAKYIFRSWLDAHGDLALVEESIRCWLAVHATDDDADFVFRGWLDTHGDLKVVEEPIRRWLTVHATNEGAKFVFRGWLDADGDPKVVEEPLRRWLAVHSTDEDADFVFRGWLDNGGGLKVVEEPLRRWLAVHGAEIGANYIYRGWLEADGDLKVVEEPIRRWLGVHSAEIEASYIYRGWLEADGELGVVEAPIQHWLTTHATLNAAMFVYSSWLDAGGSLVAVRRSVIEYVKTYPLLDTTGYVYASWLGAGGELELVRSDLLQWIKLYGTDTNAPLIISYVARCPDLPPDAVQHLLHWCKQFATDGESLEALTRLSVYFGAPEFAEDAIVACRAVLPATCFAWKVIPRRLCVPITAMFLQLFGNPAIQEGAARTRLNRLFVEWLQHPSSFGAEMEAPRILQSGKYVQWLVELVRDGVLDEHEDSCALARFAAWVDRWSGEKKQRLNRIFGDLITRILSAQ